MCSSSILKHWIHCGLLIKTSDLGFFALIILCFFKKKPLCFLAMKLVVSPEVS